MNKFENKSVTLEDNLLSIITNTINPISQTIKRLLILPWRLKKDLLKQFMHIEKSLQFVAQSPRYPPQERDHRFIRAISLG